jgi:hypothetical protein
MNIEIYIQCIWKGNISITENSIAHNIPVEKTVHKKRLSAWNITTTYDVIVSVIYMDVETEPPTCYDYVTIGGKHIKYIFS